MIITTNGQPDPLFAFPVSSRLVPSSSTDEPLGSQVTDSKSLGRRLQRRRTILTSALVQDTPESLVSDASTLILILILIPSSGSCIWI